MSASNANGRAPGELTYDDVRDAARWLNVFTASDLADALHVPPPAAVPFIRALLFHGIAFETGETLDGPLGDEALLEMVIHPPGPRSRPRRTPPEVLEGYDLAPRRGLPVRLVDHGKRGTTMSNPGERKKLKDRERAYRQQVEAEETRRLKSEAQRRSVLEHRHVSVAEVRRAKDQRKEALRKKDASRS